MSKCGKGCMPECEYFTTGGCISPFNCLYKMEMSYINTATSQPERGKMTEQEREDLNTFKHDLVKQARWWQWKAETLEKENEQLKSENVTLRERLEKAVELACKVGDTVYQYDHAGNIYASRIRSIIFETAGIAFDERAIGKSIFLTEEAAEARLAELK